ncbi:GAF domain-containing protein [Marininema halotolerans]|uniref:GAF domain-containing protein n=1 Tax=Marininema halotolerans TaxID=1155944 RepID=A0A1I6RN88_9BACL|nr:GAF domain-containing protein [Marininema halotolerans]SFS65918.1 GAF domain-containing protein [Marininema halotolerans]
MLSIQQVEGDKNSRYEGIFNQAKGLFHDERDWLANMANSASLLYHTLGEVNWVGYYLLKENELVLGPFMGLPACIRIGIGQGVCGTAVKEKRTQRVPDVHAFPGHIACDAATRSEIVIPIQVNGNVLAVLDIDSPQPERFDQMDQQHLESFVQLLTESTDWTHVPTK